MALLMPILLLFASNAFSETISNSYLVNGQVPIDGSLTRYVQISGAPSNAVITNVEAKFDYTAYGVVQDYVSCHFNKDSDPGPSGGLSLVSQGSLPEGDPGTYGYVSFSSWNGESVDGNYYFRFATASGSPYAPTIHTIYVRVTYSIPSLMVTYPNGGKTLTKGQDYTITWNSTNVTGNIQIDLYKGPTNVLQLAAAAPNTGSYPFNPPESLADGSDYRIGISAMNGTVWNFSDGYFTIEEATLPPPTLISPINDETVTSVLLQWEEMANAAGYELDVDGNQVIISDGNQTSYSPTLNYGTHRWRVRTKNSSGVYGPWSEYAYFTYSLGRYSLSNGYIFLSGTNGYIDELKVDPTGSSSYGQNIINENGKLCWQINGVAFSNENTTIVLYEENRIVLDNQAGAQWDIQLNGSQFSSWLNLFYIPGDVQIKLDIPYEDSGYFDYAQRKHWEVDNNHAAPEIPFKTFYSQTGNTRTIEYFMRNEDVNDLTDDKYRRFRTNFLGDVRHIPDSGSNRLIAIGTGNFDIDFNNLPSHNIWIEKASNMLSLCSGGQTDAQTINFDFRITNIDEYEGVEINEAGDKMPYFYTSSNQTITNSYGGQYTFDELLNRFYRQSAFYYTDVGLNIWWNWASKYCGFVNNWYRNILKNNIKNWHPGDDGHGHTGYMWTWGSNMESPAGEDTWLTENYDTRHLNTNALFIQAVWNYYAWTGDEDFLAWMNEQLEMLRDAMQYQLDWLGGGTEYIINACNHQGEDHRGIHNEDVLSNYWDIYPFGGKDAYASIDFYNSLLAMAQIEYTLGNKLWPDRPE
jgi:hypothetical protein